VALTDIQNHQVFCAVHIQTRLVICQSSQTSDGDRYLNGIEIYSILCSARVRCRVIDPWLSDCQLTAVVANHNTRPRRRVDDVAIASPLDAQVLRLGRVGRGLAHDRDVIGGRDHLSRRSVNYHCPLYKIHGKSHSNCMSDCRVSISLYNPVTATNSNTLLQ